MWFETRAGTIVRLVMASVTLLYLTFADLSVGINNSSPLLMFVENSFSIFLPTTLRLSRVIWSDLSLPPVSSRKPSVWPCLHPQISTMHLSPLLFFSSFLALTAARCSILTTNEFNCLGKADACLDQMNWVCGFHLKSSWQTINFHLDGGNAVFRAVCIKVPDETTSGNIEARDGIKIHWDSRADGAVDGAACLV